MLSAVLRRSVAVAAILALAMVASGCGDVRRLTQWSTDRTNGVSARAGEILVRGALIVASDQSQQAALLATFANEGSADELVRVRVGSVESEPEGGPLSIPARGYARLGPDGTQLQVDGLEARLGRMVEVEFIFAAAPRTTVKAYVQPAEGIYADTFSAASGG